MYLNRVVAVTAALVSLGLAVLPVVGDFDWTSTAGVIAGIVAVLGIVQKWLGGWQAHEARQTVIAPAVSDDEGPGDPDALPHFPAKNPGKVPKDKGDAGAQGQKS